MRRVLVAVVVAVSSFSCGTDFTAVEAKTSALCQQITGQQFEVPSDVRAVYEKLPVQMQRDVEITRSFAFDLGSVIPAALTEYVTPVVKLGDIAITAQDGSGSLDFVSTAIVTLVPPASSGLTQQSFSYVRESEDVRVIRWASDDFDITPYLTSGSLNYEVTLSGRLPSESVVVDVNSCASASATLDYL